MCTYILRIHCVCYSHDGLICHIKLDLLFIQLSLDHKTGGPDKKSRQEQEHIEGKYGTLVDLSLLHQVKFSLLQYTLSRAVKNSQMEDILP